jgi:hypothetical protein
MTTAQPKKIGSVAKWHRTLIAGVALAALAIVCAACAASRDGYLYDARVARAASFRFESSNAKQGSVVVEFAGGEHCSGKFNAVAGVVEMDQETGRVAREDSQTGRAILECSAGRVVRCAFERDHAGEGSGQCSDNAGRTFELYF